jgi:hypothetical protein
MADGVEGAVAGAMDKVAVSASDSGAFDSGATRELQAPPATSKLAINVAQRNFGFISMALYAAAG